MASLRRYYRTPRSSSAGPATVYVVPRATTNTTAAPTTAEQEFAVWAKNQHSQLVAVQDQEKLAALANGHTQEFLDYAKQRVNQAESDDERTYWQSLITQATAKIEDDNIAADVSSGKRPLEDLVTHLNDRLKALPGGQKDPQYGAVVKQIGMVNDAIAARDMNSQMVAGQKAIFDAEQKGPTEANAARTDYLKLLDDLYYRARDPKAQDTIKQQMSQVRGDIAKDQLLIRAREDNQKVVDYRAGKLGGAELIDFFSQRAATAQSSAEADRYATLAQQVEANERTKQNAAVAAARSGAASAITDALFTPEQNYKFADAKLRAELDQGTPSQETVNNFITMAQHYRDVLQQVIPQADAARQSTLLDEYRSVIKNVPELQKQTAEKVVAGVDRQVTGLNALIAEAKSSGDLESLSLARFQAAQAIRDALANPLVQSVKEQSDRLATQLDTVTRDQKKDIASTAALLAGNSQTKAMGRLPGLYKSYQDAIAANSKTPLDAKGMDDWSNALSLALTPKDQLTPEMQQKEIDLFGRVLDGDGGKNDLNALKSYLGADITPRNLLDFRTVRDDHNTEIDAATKNISTLTAQRGPDGRQIPYDQLVPDAATIAAERSYQLQAQQGGPMIGPASTGGAAYMDASGRLVHGTQPDVNGPRPTAPAPMPELIQPRPVNDVAPSDTGMDNTQPYSTQPDPWSAGGALDESTRALAHHANAQSYLQSDSPVSLPSWEIPSLPQSSPFMPSGTASFSFSGDETGAPQPEPPPLTSIDWSSLFGNASPPPLTGGASGPGGDATAPLIAA